MPQNLVIETLEPGSWRFEQKLWQAGYALVAGIDEAGRGALAGPVVAAAVILPLASYPYKDSKTLSAKKRYDLAQDIKSQALAWAIGQASPAEIDKLNILQATHLAAQRALGQLELRPDALLTDYLKLEFAGIVLAPAKADALSSQVAAASILAKTSRDQIMINAALSYPEYLFERHKGYGAKAHLEAINSLGACPLHRRSFRPVLQAKLFQ
jgi:ribonuclease HII